MRDRRRLAGTVVLLFAVAALAGLLLHGPVPQPAAYHDFADARPGLGLANAADVLSNLPFLVVGLVALVAAARAGGDAAPLPRWERGAFAAYGAGVLLTSVGSAYYHLAPDDARLVWDRLPMAVAFGPFCSLVLGERAGARLGRLSLAPLLAIGAGGVLHWAWTLSRAPGGDLRVLLWAKFVPVVAAALFVLLVPEPRGTRRPLLLSIGLFALATALEALDRPTYEATGGLVSGHTLKHLAAAAAAACLVAWFSRRRAPA
jgi:hypothetical protein